MLISTTSTSGDSSRTFSMVSLPVPGLAHHPDVRFLLQQRTHALAHDGMVVGEEDGDFVFCRWHCFNFVIF